MDASEIAVPLASTAAGGISVIWVAKAMITNWLAKHDRLAITVQEHDKAIAVMVSELEHVVKDLNGVANMVRAKLGGVKNDPT